MSNVDLEKIRISNLRKFAIQQALERLDRELPDLKSEEIVDGGTDRTAEVARSFPGVVVIEFPVNLGHGVALQVTYRYCVNHGVKYVVTLDADGQNDPSEIPQILVPLLADTADFVLGSRVLGVDKTTDRVRKLGVRFFSFIMNRMTGSH